MPHSSCKCVCVGNQECKRNTINTKLHQNRMRMVRKWLCFKLKTMFTVVSSHIRFCLL